MAGKTIWPVKGLEPGKAVRVKVPTGVDQAEMIRRGKVAVTSYRHRAAAKAGTKKAKAAILAQQFEVLASGAGHVRVKRAA